MTITMRLATFTASAGGIGDDAELSKALKERGAESYRAARMLPNRATTNNSRPPDSGGNQPAPPPKLRELGVPPIDFNYLRGYISFMFIQAAILFMMLAAAHGNPARSPVLAAIDPNDDSMSLPDMIHSLDADGKKSALEGLDRLDRAVLDSDSLSELSEAYRLLGRNDDALNSARSLSSRNPGQPIGDILAVQALAQAGDFSSAQSAAEEGLKRFPGDRNLIALLHQVKGRVPPRNLTGPSDRFTQNQAIPAPPGQVDPAPRASPNFASRQPGNARPSFDVPPPAEVSDRVGGNLGGIAAWTKRKIDESAQAMMTRIDRSMGLQSDERGAALKGAGYGAMVGTGIGVVGGGVVASGVCAPALATGVPYGACVVAGSAGGVMVGAPSIAYLGGIASVKIRRVKADLDKIFESNMEGVSSQAE